MQEIIIRIIVDTNNPTDPALTEIADYAVRETVDSYTATEVSNGHPTGEAGYEGPFVVEATAIHIDGPTMAIGDTVVRWTENGGYE